MKLNFKYAMMSCAMLALGFTSCSDNDGEGDLNLPVEGAETYVTIDLSAVTASTRATYADEPEERTINDAVVYVFNGNKVLEAVEDFGSATSKTFKSTVGLHYFLAAANLPDDITIPLGSGMEEVETTLNSINKTVFDGFIQANNFFMTSGVVTGTNGYRAINAASRTLVEATEAEAPTENPVTIKIGRAMAKLNMSVNPSVVVHDKVTLEGVEYNTAGGEIEPTTATFVVANNPSSMYFFPHFESQLFQTPHFADFNDILAPQDFWPALHKLTGDPAEGYTAASYDGEYTAINYIMENGNKKPTYGNATVVSLKVKFKPDAKFISSGGTLTNGTFWRLWDNVTEAYTTQVIDNKNVPVFYKSEAEATSAINGDQKVVEYTEGYCYYIIPVEDISTSAAARYNVYRNHFYSIGVRTVYACGHGNPGGESETEPVDPLDPEDVYVAVSIEVLPWELVNQNVDLKD